MVSALLLASLLVAACGGVRDAFGTDSAAARAAADDLLGALAARFGPTAGSQEHAAARSLLLKHSFSPSALLDAPLWHERTGPLRKVGFVGSPAAGGHYHFGVAAQPPRLSVAGSARTVLSLTDQGEGGFVWERRDELATGHFGGEAASAGWSALLRALELPAARGEDASLRLRRELPRTTRALGRALGLNALDARRDGETTVVALALELAPSALQATHPRYARFFATYVTPMQAWLRAEDAAGRPLLTAEGGQMRLTVRFRVRDGRLVTLTAPHVAAGGRFVLRMGFSTKSSMFRVGLDELRAQGEAVDGPAAGVALTFREEPRWRLPFVVKPLLRSPLRRPFEGDGSRIAFAFAALGEDRHSVSREYRFAVKENWITRWMGSMASGTVQDFRNGAEAEADAFTREAMLALRDDLRALR